MSERRNKPGNRDIYDRVIDQWSEYWKDKPIRVEGLDRSLDVKGGRTAADMIGTAYMDKEIQFSSSPDARPSDSVEGEAGADNPDDETVSL